MVRLLCSALFVCLSFGLFDCSQDEAPKPHSSPGLKPLVVGVMSSLDYLPLAIAEREGYFAELGAPITIQPFFSANERDAAFQSKSIDGTIIDFTGAIIQHASGVDLRLTSRCDAPFYLLSSPESKVTRIAGLEGRSVAISQNTVIDYLVDQALVKNEVPTDSVSRVEINRIPIRYEMLANNKIDATGLPNPFALLAVKSGATVLTSNKDMNLSITGIMFTLDAIHQKPEQIRKLYQAYSQGVCYLLEHPVSDYQDILVERFGYTEDIIPQTPALKYGYPALPDAQSIIEVTQWLKQRQLIREDYDPTDSLLDGQFLPQ